MSAAREACRRLYGRRLISSRRNRVPHQDDEIGFNTKPRKGDGFYMDKIRLMILCSWGATSSSLAVKVQKAAEKRGIPLQADAGGTGEFKKKAKEYDVALLEPQVRHLKGEMEAVAKQHNIPLEVVDMSAFALMDGDKVLDQVLRMLKRE
jgi:PTS system cellobiose-specific IIB component